MVKALVALLRLIVTVPALEFVGAVAIVAGVCALAGWEWALVAFGAVCLLKSLDLAAQGK